MESCPFRIGSSHLAYFFQAVYISSPFLFVTEQYLLPAVGVPELSHATFEGHPGRSSTIFCVNIVCLSLG